MASMKILSTKMAVGLSKWGPPYFPVASALFEPAFDACVACLLRIGSSGSGCCQLSSAFRMALPARGQIRNQDSTDNNDKLIIFPHWAGYG